MKKIKNVARNNKLITVQFSDFTFWGNKIIFPPNIAGEYQLNSFSELNEKFHNRNFIEINVTGTIINKTDSLELFLEENKNGYEIHCLFIVSDSQIEPKYQRCFLISK